MPPSTSFSLTLLYADKEEAYATFVENHPASLFYHTLAYRNLLVEILQAKANYWIVLDENGNNVIGVLPLFLKEGSLGRVYNSLPYYGSNGAILAQNQEVFDAILRFYNEFCQEKEVAASTIITNPLLENDFQNRFEHTLQDHRIGQWTYLPKEKTTLMDIFHYKTRNMVRKSLKEDIVVSIDNSQKAMRFLYETHQENMTAIGGKAKPWSFFENIVKFFNAGKDYQIYVASIKQAPVAALLLFYHNQTIEYYTPVIVEQYRDKQPLSGLIFRAMQDGIDKGFENWNWGGTWVTQDGVYRFKSRWGAVDIPYYYYTKINNNQVLKADKQLLLKEYENFFVLPFQYLES